MAAAAVLSPHNAMDAGPQVLMPPAPLGGFFVPVNSGVQNFQQQAAAPPARPKEHRSNQKRRKGGQGRGQGRRQGRTGAGGQQQHPTLSSLQKANAKRARRHFQQQSKRAGSRALARQESWVPAPRLSSWARPLGFAEPPMETPRSVPRAPLNTNEYLMTQTGVSSAIVTRLRPRIASLPTRPRSLVKAAAA